jgi:pimeloyl-ACP methyl ester carboxylesterase
VNFSVEPAETGHIEVEGCAIAFATWGTPGQLGVVLVHGAGAQMGWWDAVIPELLDDRHIVAFDLSGNGDSAWRPRYTGDRWAAELVAAAEHLGGQPVLVVGHSLGARISIIAAATRPDLVDGLVLVDGPLRRPSDQPRRLRIPANRGYATLQDALGSFHLRPPEPVLDRDLLMRVAANSFVDVEGRWALKADPQIYGQTDDRQVLECLTRVEVPITFVYGDRSTVVDDEVRSILAETQDGAVTLVAVRGGFHHLTFDHAAAVAAAISHASVRSPLRRFGP